MLRQFLEYIHDKKLFQPTEKILLTVSGGVDSVVMEELFHRAGFPYVIAHCNFKLRDEDSEDDEIFVNELAGKHKVPFFVKQFETKTYAKKNRISIQMAARELRNLWFEGLLKEQKLAAYATAHHLDDSLETALFNLTKGTGIAGLQGIRPKTGHVVRPLLFASKAMIEDFAHNNSLAWREDRSNTNTKYHRNLIRHQVIPILRTINPNLVNTFLYTSHRIRSATQILSDQVESARKQLVEKKEGRIWISIKNLQKLNTPALILHEIIKEFQFNYYQASEIIARADGISGKVFYSSTHSLNIDREYLIVNKIDIAEDKEYIMKSKDRFIDTGLFQLEIKIMNASEFFLPDDPSVAVLDAEKLKYPLKIRKWRVGDKFCPLGMKGKKKLSDFMIDEKIPLNLKQQVHVLISDTSIAWVINNRIDDRFKVDDKTKSILILKTNKHG